MSTAAFVINDRFTVHADTNSVVDGEAGTTLRMEPRHMKLLCALAEREGQVVERSALIERIWNNYGGADDALNQAISFLRKMLGDEARQLIETIPKTGYILHARITALQAAGMRPGRSPKTWFAYAAAGLALVAVLAAWYARSSEHEAPRAPVDTTGPHEAAAAPEAP